MKLTFIQKIKLLGKINKAYKASKKLIDSKQGFADEVKKVIENLKADFEALVALLPDFKESYNEVKKIIENAF